jgi:hypothetical protein
MKTLVIGDRYFDPEEVDYFELMDAMLYVHYKLSDLISKIKFDSNEKAALEYYSLPEYLKKKIHKKTQ